MPASLEHRKQDLLIIANYTKTKIGQSIAVFTALDNRDNSSKPKYKKLIHKLETANDNLMQAQQNVNVQLNAKQLRKLVKSITKGLKDYDSSLAAFANITFNGLQDSTKVIFNPQIQAVKHDLNTLKKRGLNIERRALIHDQILQNVNLINETVAKKSKASSHYQSLPIAPKIPLKSSFKSGTKNTRRVRFNDEQQVAPIKRVVKPLPTPPSPKRPLPMPPVIPKGKQALSEAQDSRRFTKELTQKMLAKFPNHNVEFTHQQKDLYGKLRKAHDESRAIAANLSKALKDPNVQGAVTTIQKLTQELIAQSKLLDQLQKQITPPAPPVPKNVAPAPLAVSDQDYRRQHKRQKPQEPPPEAPRTHGGKLPPPVDPKLIAKFALEDLLNHSENDLKKLMGTDLSKRSSQPALVRHLSQASRSSFELEKKRDAQITEISGILKAVSIDKELNAETKALVAYAYLSDLKSNGADLAINKLCEQLQKSLDETIHHTKQAYEINPISYQGMAEAKLAAAREHGPSKKPS